MKNQLVPSNEEIILEMELHNADEVGIDNQWDYEDAEYYLLLSDKYYYANKENEAKTPLVERICLPIGRLLAISYPICIILSFNPNLYGSIVKAFNQLLNL